MTAGSSSSAAPTRLRTISARAQYATPSPYGASAAVPVDVSDQPVDVLLELPGQTALADAADAGDRHQARRALRRRSRGTGPCSRRSSRRARRTAPPGRSARLAPPRAATTRSARQAARAPPCPSALLAGILEGDRRVGGAPGGLADEHRARRRHRLQRARRCSRGRRRPCPGRRAERHGGLPGEDAARARLRSRVGAEGRTASTSSSAARTARSASSSCATGAPQTAMTASPMNFSMVPP